MYDNEKWIYDAICQIKNPGPVFEFSPNEEIYNYKNTLFPNKKYSKTFNPKSFMKRGDVINFGGVYRNENTNYWVSFFNIFFLFKTTCCYGNSKEGGYRLTSRWNKKW